MDNKSRTSNTLRNLKVGLIMQILGYALSFVNRTVFVYVIGMTYLGVNSLFTNILMILSFTEAGAEAAFSSLLYRPLRDGNKRAVAMIMNAFRKTFAVIGGIVAVIGISIIPFLGYLISDEAKQVENIVLVYLLFLYGSVVNYIFTYKISLIKADQKTYIISIYDEIIAIAQYALQIAVVAIWHNFVLYVAVQMGLQILRNILLSRKSSKMYPYLDRHAPPLPPKAKASVFRRIRGGIWMHTGFIIANGTDSIVITKFLGLDVNGKYANYLMITTIVGCLFKIVFDSVSASVGDLIAEGDRRKIYRYFRTITFTAFVMFSVAAVGMLVMFNSFIRLWFTAADCTFGVADMILIVIVFLVGNYGIKRPLALFKNACGLFYNDRYFALAEGICNLVLSLILVRFIGFAGVMIGTIVSSMITICSGAYVLYKHLFKRPLFVFFFRLTVYSLFTAACAGLVAFGYSFIGCGNWLAFLLEGIGAVVFTGAAIVLVFGKTPEFRFVSGFVMRYIPKRFLPKGKAVATNKKGM